MTQLFLLLITSCLYISDSYAQTVDLFDESTSIETSALNNNSSENSSDENSETETDGDSSILSIITKPLSILFSADDIVTSEEGKKETFLEKSIREANEGKLESQMNLGYMYLYGTNGVEPNPEEAIKYYTMAAEQKDPIATNNLGSLYFNGIGTQKNYNKALELFKAASDLGNDDASLNLAFIYLTGGKKNSYRNKMAVEYLTRSSKGGNNIATFMLGYAYYKGFVVPLDYKQAYTLVKKAADAESNLDEAQIVLGEMYISGNGVIQNYGRGVAAYKNAASQGNVEAFMKLADIYMEGKLVVKDEATAHILYNMAAVQGNKEAAALRDELSNKLELDVLRQAQEQASEFKISPSELTQYVRQTFGYDIRYYIDINQEKVKEKGKQ